MPAFLTSSFCRPGRCQCLAGGILKNCHSLGKTEGLPGVQVPCVQCVRLCGTHPPVVSSAWKWMNRWIPPPAKPFCFFHWHTDWENLRFSWMGVGVSLTLPDRFCVAKSNPCGILKSKQRFFATQFPAPANLPLWSVLHGSDWKVGSRHLRIRL